MHPTYLPQDCTHYDVITESPSHVHGRIAEEGGPSAGPWGWREWRRRLHKGALVCVSVCPASPPPLTGREGSGVRNNGPGGSLGVTKRGAAWLLQHPLLFVKSWE